MAWTRMGEDKDMDGVGMCGGGLPMHAERNAIYWLGWSSSSSVRKRLAHWLTTSSAVLTAAMRLSVPLMSTSSGSCSPSMMAAVSVASA
eukprot:5684459-Pyramimonas_sp.AAC.2